MTTLITGAKETTSKVGVYKSQGLALHKSFFNT